MVFRLTDNWPSVQRPETVVFGLSWAITDKACICDDARRMSVHSPLLRSHAVGK